MRFRFINLQTFVPFDLSRGNVRFFWKVFETDMPIQKGWRFQTSKNDGEGDEITEVFVTQSGLVFAIFQDWDSECEDDDSLCYSLWSEKKKAMFIGRDFGREILSLINGFDLKELADIYPCLRSYYHDQAQRITERYGEDLLDYYMTAVQDKITCIQEIAGRCKNLSGFMQELKDLFHIDMTDEQEESIDYTKIIRLSSIHRAKGSEAPRVFILAPEKLPLGKATTEW